MSISPGIELVDNTSDLKELFSSLVKDYEKKDNEKSTGDISDSLSYSQWWSKSKKDEIGKIMKWYEDYVKILNQKSNTVDTPIDIPELSNLKTQSDQETTSVSPINSTTKLTETEKSRLLRLAHDRDRPVRILTLGGGGLRGILSCQILKELESHLGGMRIADVFDLIIGTSTGGLLALGLGRFRKTVHDCETLYNKFGDVIFGKSTSGNSQSLEAILLDSFGIDEKEPLKPVEKSTPLVSVVVTVANKNNLAFPALLRSYPLGGNESQKLPYYRGTCNVTLIKAALATSAAPFYFNPVSVKNNKDLLRLVDGGLNANMPALLAAGESYSLWKNRRKIIVSIGTGEADDSKEPNKPPISLLSLLSSLSPSLRLLLGTLDVVFSAKEALYDQTLSIFNNLGFIDYFLFNPLLALDKMGMDKRENMEHWTEKGAKYATKRKDDLKGLAEILLACNNTSILNEAQLYHSDSKL